MNGKLWEFAPEEMSGMPGFMPMMNKESRVIGMRMYQWYMNGMYYIRFVEEDDYRNPEKLAGWQ